MPARPAAPQRSSAIPIALAVAGAVAAGPVAASGCAEAPSTPIEIPVAAPAAPVEGARAAPESTPARWFRRRGKNLWGPMIGDATLVLLGGRRALVGGPSRDLVRLETVQAPEPLVDLAVVPVAGGALRVVGVGEHGVYRFDDPLGAGVPIARGTTKLTEVAAFPGLAAVWSDRGGENDFVDVETGRRAAVPRGVPAPRPLGFVFQNEREGVALLVAVGAVATTDGGATWRMVRESSPGDLERVRGIRFRDGAVELRDTDGRPGIVDVATATLGQYRGAPRPEEEGAPIKVPPLRGDEAPLAYWMRISQENPIALAVEAGAPGHDGLPGPKATGLRGTARVSADGLWARVDPVGLRVSEVNPIPEGDNSSFERSAVVWPLADGSSTLQGGKQAYIGNLDGAGEPYVEVLQDRRQAKFPPIRFPDGHGKLSLMSPIEEDVDHALRLVLADEHHAYVVIQRSPTAAATAVAVPGATHAVIHGTHGIAVGPLRVLVSADSGSTWSDVPAPKGFAEAVASLGKNPDAKVVVSALGAEVGDFVRVGWGPPEPPAPEGPPASATPVPAEDPGSPAPALVCTAAGPSKGPPPKGKVCDTLLKNAIDAEMKKHGATGDPSIYQGDLASFTPNIGFAHDDGARVWAAAWIDGFDIGATTRVWSTSAPTWAGDGAWLSSLSSASGTALVQVTVGDPPRIFLARVEPDGGSESAEMPKAMSIQGEFGVTSTRRGPLTWMDGNKLMLWRWGEGPRPVITFPGATTLISAEDPISAGIVLRVLDPGFGAYRLLPYPAPGAPVTPPTLDGWTRFDAASEHPDRLPACPKQKPYDIAVRVIDRPLHARIDGVDKETTTGAMYGLHLTGKEACVWAVWAHFGDAATRTFVRAELTTGKADGGDEDVRHMTCAWH